jgi:hypothetical protein
MPGIKGMPTATGGGGDMTPGGVRIRGEGGKETGGWLGIIWRHRLGKAMVGLKKAS